MMDVLVPNSAGDHFTEAPFSNFISNCIVFFIISAKCFLLALPLATGLPTGLLDTSLVERKGLNYLVIAANSPV
jgi:hypothetical protein